MGQVIYDLSKYVVHVNAAVLVFATQIALYLVAGGLLTFLSLKKRGPWLPWMLLSPAGLLFAAMDPPGGYRKDELLLLPVLCLAVAIGRKPAARRAWIAAGVTLYFFSIFSWEPSVFFLPFILVFLHASLPLRLARRVTLAVACVSVACSAAVVAFHGNAAIVGGITDSLPAVGVPKAAGTGAIRALELSLGESVRGTLGVDRDAKHYFLSFLLSLIPFVASGWMRRNKAFFLLSVLWGLPQYFVACDWGRWIHALITCMSIHWLVMDYDDPLARKFLGIPRWCYDIVLLVWCSSWSMAHCDTGFRRDPNLLGAMQSIIQS
jgi:hypothetical protein